ncbi:class I SAM-dependent methyltransferase [Ignavibacterium album]|uniref:class I SAM-dependent DNA methyltransferase n=2 Tax=Ignavibacterium album TaxID=591197 RepID=UPI0026EAD7AC|nr:methyltransferase domain-containing protein [Ignavibacterium album]
MQELFQQTGLKVKDNYKYVSDIYDQLMSKVDYKFWAKYLYKLSLLYVSKNSKVLEVASGNCRLAEYLSSYFKSYFASDVSLSMLKKNKSHSFQKVCCDMTLLPFKIRFDLVICAFDSINYLTNKKSIQKFFAQIKNILNQDGIFLFDAALEQNSFKHQKYATKKGSLSGVTFNRQSIYLQSSRIHKNIFEIIYPDGTKFREIHKQKIYPLEFYFEALEKAGLYAVECFNAFTFRDCKQNDLRAQFVVKRKN